VPFNIRVLSPHGYLRYVDEDKPLVARLRRLQQENRTYSGPNASVGDGTNALENDFPPERVGNQLGLALRNAYELILTIVTLPPDEGGSRPKAGTPGRSQSARSARNCRRRRSFVT
jgi:hypothetical protein